MSSGVRRLIRILAAAIIIAVPACFFGRFAIKHAEFRRTAAPILELGGRVYAGADGMGEFLGSKGVRYVDLAGTKVTDADFRRLRPSLESAEVLDLNDTAISDEGLMFLEGITTLWRLQLDGTQVTRQGVEKIRKSLPATVELSWTDSQDGKS